MIGFCLVGCGRIATLNALGYKDNPDGRLYAVCDVDRARAEAFAKEYGAEKIYTDYQEVLRDPNIHAVDLLVPHHLHCRMVIDACAAKKHVSVQKPMALTVEECDRMIAAAREHGVKLKVFENFVFYPPYVKAKQLIDEGVIGEPITMRYKMNAGRQDLGWAVDPKTWGWRMAESTCGGGPVMVYRDGEMLHYNVPRHDWADSFVDSTRDFIDAIKNDRAPVLTGEDGREVLRFALGAIESSRTKSEVFL